MFRLGFGSAIVLCALCRLASGQNVLAYLQSRLIEPLGLTSFRIGRDRAGNPNLPGGALLGARDWSRFGQFVLDQARQGREDNGEFMQLLDPDLLAECFRPGTVNPRYGLT